MSTRTGVLYAISPTGTFRTVPNSYEGIKDGINDATMDFIVVTHTAGYYIDDEGMLNNSPLNVPASMFAGRPIYGPVVLTAADTDDEGDTLPPNDRDVQVLRMFSQSWKDVTINATNLGQDINVYPNADTIPPPTVTGFSGSPEEMIEHFFRGAPHYPAGPVVSPTDGAHHVRDRTYFVDGDDTFEQSE